MLKGSACVVSLMVLGAVQGKLSSFRSSASIAISSDDPADDTYPLPGQDISQGDAAWRERLSELNRRHPEMYTRGKTGTNHDRLVLSTAAPLTTVYVLAHHFKQLFKGDVVPKVVRIHILGATFSFEGRGDWRLLGDALPQGVRAEVLLVLGTPEQADGVPEMQMSMLAAKKKFCRKHGKKVSVRCHMDFYQTVPAGKTKKPHLAMMFNPGFPQVHRRTWDSALLMLLSRRIPTAVSAQVSTSKGWPEAGKSWNSFATEYANEDFPVNATLVAYNARTWGATGSPFPIVEKDPDILILKNAVIEVFQGVKPGIHLPQPPSHVKSEDLQFLRNFDWEPLEERVDDTSLHDEMKFALETPVSLSYERAADSVYLHYLQQSINEDNFRKKPVSVRRKAKALLKRMRKGKALKAKDWVFLKDQFDLD